MRIGIRAHDVAYAPLEELIPNIHAQGFHCMHIALSKSIKEFKPGVETMTPGLAMYIKELCTENKVDVAVLGCYLNLCNPNPEKHKEIKGHKDRDGLKKLPGLQDRQPER